jgi:hypothetical protein
VTIRSQGGAAEFWARQIRKAIRDAEADGFVVDFGWDGFLDERRWYLAVGIADTNWKEAVRIWPTSPEPSSTTTTIAGSS